MKKGRDQRWGTVPTEELPLRATLLRVSEASRGRLMDYVLNQVRHAREVMPWLLKRQWAYWVAHGYEFNRVGEDGLHQQIDAAIALDLVEWQSGEKGPRETMKWLEGVMEMNSALSEGAGK